MGSTGCAPRGIGRWSRVRVEKPREGDVDVGLGARVRRRRRGRRPRAHLSVVSPIRDPTRFFVKQSAQISRSSSLVSALPWRRKARWTGGRCRRSSAAPPPRVAASKPREPRPRIIRNPGAGACSPRPTRHPHPHRGTRPSPCWKTAGTAARTTSGAQLCLDPGPGPATHHPHPWRRPRGSTLARAWRYGNARGRYSCAHR